MFYRPLLRTDTQHRYIVSNMCSIPSLCPSSFPQAYSATPMKWPNCDNRCKILGTVYRRMTFGIFMTVCMPEYTPALLPEVATLCIDVTGHPLLRLVCFIIYSYNDKLPVTSIFNRVNLYLRMLRFSGSVYMVIFLLIFYPIMFHLDKQLQIFLCHFYSLFRFHNVRLYLF